MGNQSSVANNVSEIVSSVVTDVMLSNSQQCSQNNESNQVLNFSNIRIPDGCSADFSNINQTMVKTPNFQCIMESSNQSDIVNQISQELGQVAQAVTSGLSGAIVSSAQSNNTANVRNSIANKIGMSNTASCVQSNLSKQFQNYDNISGQGCPKFCSNPAICALPLKNAGFSEEYIVKQCSKDLCKFNWNNITQNMTQKAVAECLSTNKNLSETINKVSQKISQEASAENKGIDFASSLASLGSFAIPLLICVCLVCLIFSSSISSIFMGGFKGSGNSDGGNVIPIDSGSAALDSGDSGAAALEAMSMAESGDSGIGDSGVGGNPRKLGFFSRQWNKIKESDMAQAALSHFERGIHKYQT